MNCTNCGSEIKEGAKFCTVCGAVIAEAETPVTEASVDEASVVVAEPVYQAPNKPAKQENKIPEKYSPLSPWAYFGLQILFAVPIVGFVFLIVFSINKSNINRRNFARSYWCKLIIAAIAIGVVLVVALIMGISLSSIGRFGGMGGMDGIGAEMMM